MVKYIKSLQREIIMSKYDLRGKTAVITGASGGIGFNVEKILVEKYDCKVIGIARNEEKILCLFLDDRRYNTKEYLC